MSKNRIFNIILISIIAFSIQSCSLNKKITIERDNAGKPIWTNNPLDLGKFVNYIIDNDLDTEDLMLMADYRQPVNEFEASNGKVTNISDSESWIKVKRGYNLPLFLDGRDNVFGVFTEFPAFIGVGQSWNLALAKDIGEIIGNEKRGTIGFEEDNGKTLIFSAIGDIRNNPLSGRYDEGFGEDPFLTSVFVENVSTGITGVNLTDNNKNNDFYLKVPLMSKHFAVYNAQWFRMAGSNNVSNRALHEYQLPSFLRSLKSGSIIGFMTSYGRTNGVPNPISPNLKFARSVSAFKPLIITDFGAPINFVKNFAGGAFGNGLDKNYVPDNEHMSALFLKAGSPKGIYYYNGNPGFPTATQTNTGISSGLFNVNQNDLKKAVRPILETYVRLGYFNKPLNNGKNGREGYPYNNLINEPSNGTDSKHVEIALKSATESVVLLKNSNGLLPLDKNKTVLLTGPLANSRYKSVYAVKKSPNLESVSLTPFQALKNISNNPDNLKMENLSRIIAIKSVLNNRYINSKDGKGFTNYESLENAEKFQVFDMGQNAVALKSLKTGKWLAATTGSVITNYDTNGMPPRFRIEINSDNTISIIAQSYFESFVENNAIKYYTNGRLLEVYNNSLRLKNTTLTNKNNIENRDNKNKFIIEEIKYSGEDITENMDIAIVVIGAPTTNSSGEGMDRSDLSLGLEQYKLVTEVANKYPGKTVVILKSNYPVLMDAIQNNKNVTAILYQPYAGQFDGIALANIVYGNSVPSGKLTSTWYKTNAALPKISKYSIPDGTNITLNNIDPRIKTDYTNADPMESKLTYLYTDSEVTYPFGYGLSYTKFTYSNFVSENEISDKKPFVVSVDVENTGDFSGSEVVQIYIKNNNSEYKEYLPKKQLIGFKKVFIPKGGIKTVEISIDPMDFSIFDVNRQEHIVESGSYTIYPLNLSNNKNPLKQSLQVNGDSIKKLILNKPTNIWKHSFASNKVIYKEVSKERTINYLGNYYAVMSTGSYSWVAMPKVELSNKTKIIINVGTFNNKISTFNIRTDSPTGPVLCSFSVSYTGINRYIVPSNNNTGAELKELAYKEVESKINNKVSGIHDLYITFNNEDIRLDSIVIK